MNATKRNVSDELATAEEILRVFNERRAEANKAFILAMLARRKMTGNALAHQMTVCKDLETTLEAATVNYVNAKGRVEVLRKEMKYKSDRCKTFSPNGRRIRL